MDLLTYLLSDANYKHAQFLFLLLWSYARLDWVPQTRTLKIFYWSRLLTGWVFFLLLTHTDTVRSTEGNSEP